MGSPGHPTVRLRLEEAEEALSPFAARSRLSRGRQVPVDECPLRTCFQRDRDRVIHSKAFRRLKHKTQVFIAPPGDHYRTRLTHTLEVAQIARTIARALRLNEDLTEAIALAHDLGHTPFGHAGEQALDRLLPGGFRHHEQSLRVVDYLERNGRGLNLTWEVRDGILHHSKPREGIELTPWGMASTLEAQVVKLADSIAYLNHDLDDALRAELLRPEDVPREIVEGLGATTGERIDTLVADVVRTNWWVAEGRLPGSRQAIVEGAAADGGARALAASPGVHPVPTVRLSEEALRLANALREFLFQTVYTAGPVAQETRRARFVVTTLFEFFVGHPEQLPPEFASNPRGEPLERVVADYLAGMTDRYALAVFQEHFLPPGALRAW
ncbi:MAG TPA: deoxyguanosinetriphosphate triphosphohydrolase [Chloroflexota bacterium]